MGRASDPILNRHRFILFVALAMGMLPMAISCSKPASEQATSSKPVGDQARACYNRGRSYAVKGDNDKAIAEFTEAIRLDPTFAQPYSDRGWLYDRLGKHEQAVADFTQVITLGAEERGHFARGLSRALHGEHDQAIADFTEVIRLNPKDTTAYSERGKSYRMTGKHDQAIADFTQAITASGPRPFWAYHGRGLAHADKGEHDLAIADFTQAIRLAPFPQEPYRDRGLSCAARGEHDKAIADFTQAVRLGPNDAKAYGGRGMCYAMKGEIEKGIPDLTQAIRLQPVRVEFYINRGNLYAKQHKLNEAIEDYTDAIRIEPLKCAEAFTNRAKAYRALGDEAKAASDDKMAQEVRAKPKNLTPPQVALAQPPMEKGPLAFLPGPLAFMNEHAVQRELKLTDQQIQKLSDLIRPTIEQDLKEAAKLRDVDPSELKRTTADLMKRVREHSRKVPAGVLTADQEKRLYQLQRQSEGVWAFLEPEDQSALKLSDEQKKKIKHIAARPELYQGGPSDFQKMQTFRKEKLEDAAAVLTDEQKKTWKDLIGEPFDFEAPLRRATAGER